MKGFFSALRYSRARSWWRIVWDYLGGHPAPPAGPAPDLGNVSYGEHSRQTLDFWRSRADDSSPAPVLIFFHGGAFFRGKKYFSRLLREAHAQGIAAVSVNYRLTRTRGITVADAMEDAARAVRFVRDHAAEWQIDSARIALAGNSSGGSIALWAALNNCLESANTDEGGNGGDRKAEIRCVVTHNAPTTIDPELIVNRIGGPPLEYYWPLWIALFDAAKKSHLRSARVRSLVDTCSPLNCVHSNGPPIYMSYSLDLPAGGDYPKDCRWIDVIHSLRHGEFMKERYEEAGLACTLTHPSCPAPQTEVNFLRQHLLEA